MKEFQLPNNVNACVLFVLMGYSLTPIIVVSLVNLGIFTEGFIVVWYLFWPFIFIQTGLPKIIDIAIKIQKENERRELFPTTEELNKDVDSIL